MNKIATLIFIFFMAATTFGQQPGSTIKETAKKEINDLLHSTVTKDRAWAAYLIGKNEITEMVPDLYKLAVSSQPESDSYIYKVQASALDSLIKLNASLPTEIAAKIYESFPNETLILLAKRPKENKQFLFSLLQKDVKSFQWVTICNLLTKLKSPELATKLLGEVTLTATVDIYDTSSNLGGLEGGVIGGTYGHGIPTQGERGWPPNTIYSLTDYAGNGNVVVAPGRHTIYYQTFVSKDGEPIGTGGSVGPIKRSEKDDYIIDYLGELLFASNDVKEKIRPNFTIKLRQGKNYAKEIDNIRKEVAKGYRALVNKFAEKDLLTESPVSLSIKDRLEIKVRDFRGNKKIPLPKFPDVEIVD